MLIHNADITGSLTINGTPFNSGSFSGSFQGTLQGVATTASHVDYTNIANLPTLVSGSSQITYLELSAIPSGIVSGSSQIADLGFATTGSNAFDGSQVVTGSLTVTGDIIAQTLNVQQVTSSVVYSSGSNIFGNSLTNTHEFTGSLQVSGSSHYLLGDVGIGTDIPVAELQVGKSSDVTIAMSNSSSVTSGNRGSLAWYNSSNSTVANIRAAAVTDNVGTQLEFYTRPAAGSLTQAMTLTAGGKLLINSTDTTKTPLFLNTQGNFASSGNMTTGFAISDTSFGRALNMGVFESGGYAWIQSAYINNADVTFSLLLNPNGGNVLIGTTDNIGARLNVNGSIATTFLAIPTTAGQVGSINSSNANGGYLTWETSGTVIADIGTSQQIFGTGGNDTFGINGRGARALVFGTNQAERLRITSGGQVNIGGNYTSTNNTLQVTGNVAIGTTTAAPTNGLEIGGGLNVGGGMFISGPISSGGLGSRVWIPGQSIGQALYSGLYGLGLTYLAKYDNGWKSVGGGVASALTIDEGIFSFSNSQSVGAPDTSLTWTTRLTVLTNGNVGIGTHDPSVTLDINGDVRFRGSIYDQFEYIASGNFSNGTYYNIVGVNQISSGIYILEGYIDTYTAGGEIYFMRFTSVPFYMWDVGSNSTTFVDLPPVLGTGHHLGNPFPLFRLQMTLEGAGIYLQFNPNATWSGMNNSSGKTFQVRLKRIGS